MLILTALHRTTAGFTGADLGKLLNEAAIIAARARPKVHYYRQISTNAFVKVGIGVEKKKQDYF